MPRRRLPDYVEQARLDAISLALDIVHLEANQHEAHRRGNIEEAAGWGGEIQRKARRIQARLIQMKRDSET